MYYGEDVLKRKSVGLCNTKRVQGDTARQHFPAATIPRQVRNRDQNMDNIVALVTITTPTGVPAPIVASETHPSCDDLSLACLQSQLQQFTTIPTSLSPCSVVRQPV